jgi:hypothetical protein
MKNSSFDIISEKIQAFEQLESLEISEEWSSNLEQKIAVSSVKNTGINQNKILVMVAILFIVNIGFATIVLTKGNNEYSQRNTKLQVLSSELFVNDI